MIELNLPRIECNIRKKEGKIEIFDVVRKKFIQLTPEEWVRQHMIHFLINEQEYPKSLIKVESGLKYNRLQKRSDILVYSRSATPFLIVECKSYDVKITQATIDQVSVYNKQLGAPYAVVSNGLIHYCCEFDRKTGKMSFINSFPNFD
ncbi:type I restriction enzyme HsdR N-terminal domain-containing protein [Fulvivirga sp. 29W222]|uniref:Type I restriction enzyme HsdR N-terminal domain-containing protein n=1 Tax=Fulvivirga marina TaxID=2494733 RepID=A0A937FY65_9BACT|nr:type I restriction enzyme HsdR N-terminal domain-containing protein [Fulvivirga marina]MBL6448314.1 type I restriction enzyme HsdR N-terminal domain-containing protein [Fulvivirga marina]